ncbi:MAG: membrane integrity-associated transporter subunit PqiC [Myxococcota bacterium]
MRTRVVLAALFAMACAGSTPSPTYYLLPAEVPEGTVRLDPPVRVGLLPVRVAPYLAQPGLVFETEPGQVQAARQHRWAEPLGEGLRRQLQAMISQGLGFDVSADDSQRHRWDFTIEVGIDRFHGTSRGDALLVARWSVVAADKSVSVSSYRFSASQPLARSGYRGLADAEIALAAQLAAAVADSLRDLAPSAAEAE